MGEWKEDKLTAEYSIKYGFSFNTTLGNNITLLRNAVLNQDFDGAIIIDGGEGGGKSVLGMQVAFALDVDNNIDLNTQVCFTPDQFKKAVQTLKKGKAIVWDEARRGLNRRRSMGSVNLDITDMLAECRQRNLFLIIIMPSFYDMDMNAAVWRTRALIHVYYEWDTENKERPLKRGFFRFYNEEGKKSLYCDKFSRQGYRYPFLKSLCFDGTFNNHYVVDESSYRGMKASTQQDFLKRDDDRRKAYTCVRCGKSATRKNKAGKLLCPLGHEWDEI